MARKTQTTYTCDGCGKKVGSARELAAFVLERIMPGRKWNLRANKVDLCDTCEGNLIAAVEPILGASVVELRREPEPAKTSNRSHSRR
jgi:hypothetical protein